MIYFPEKYPEIKNPVYICIQGIYGGSAEIRTLGGR